MIEFIKKIWNFIKLFSKKEIGSNQIQFDVNKNIINIIHNNYYLKPGDIKSRYNNITKNNKKHEQQTNNKTN